MRPIAHTLYRIAVLGVLILTTGCQTQRGDPKRYAELRSDSAGRTQMLIRADVWKGIFTIHGYGGYAENIYYWTTLSGAGPDYRDPVFHQNAPIPREIHRGKISIDRNKKQVTIELARVVSKPGEPEKLEPSPANGKYPIKKLNQEPFMKPE